MKFLINPLYKWYSNTITNPKHRWLIVLATFFYLISPFDIAPDFLPLIGWLDDGAVLALLTTEVSRLLLEHRKQPVSEVA